MKQLNILQGNTLNRVVHDHTFPYRAAENIRNSKEFQGNRVFKARVHNVRNAVTILLIEQRHFFMKVVKSIELRTHIPEKNKSNTTGMSMFDIDIKTRDKFLKYLKDSSKDSKLLEKEKDETFKNT